MCIVYRYCIIDKHSDVNNTKYNIINSAYYQNISIWTRSALSQCLAKYVNST